MNNYKLIYIVFLFPICLFAQIKPTKSTLQKIIKNSVVEMKKGKLSLPSDNSWEFNNIDSLYFKKDTLNAFVYKEGTKHKSLCEVVDWTFYGKTFSFLDKVRIVKNQQQEKLHVNQKTIMKLQFIMW